MPLLTRTTTHIHLYIFKSNVSILHGLTGYFQQPEKVTNIYGLHIPVVCYHQKFQDRSECTQSLDFHLAVLIYFQKKNNSGVVDPLDSILKTPVDRTPASMPSSTPAPTEGSTSRPSRSVYQARMARLLSFGSPGPLSPLVSKGSQSANKDFKPPMVHRKSLGPNH